MKTDSKVLASFLAAAVLAGDEYDEFMQAFVAELSQGLELKNLESDLQTALAESENLVGEELTSKLESVSNQVNSEEKEGILLLCLQLMCADAYLSINEVENFFVFADLLGINEDVAQNILDEFVDEEEELIIEG